jgi:hypothetical protein
MGSLSSLLHASGAESYPVWPVPDNLLAIFFTDSDIEAQSGLDRIWIMANFFADSDVEAQT